MPTGFQGSVNTFPAIGVAGDFASANPRSSYVGGEAGIVAASAGVTVGNFAWLTGSDLSVANSTGSGVPDGIVHRELNALITTYLAETSLTIQAGQPVALFTKGDFYVKATVGAAAKGQKAFAKLSDGSVQFANAGATVSGFVETAWVCTRPCLVNELAVISL